MSSTRTQVFVCSCCGGSRCAFKFTTTYSLSDCSWSTPTLATTQCGSTGGEPLNTWIYDSTTSAHQWLYTSTSCTSVGDCGGAPSPPAAPPTPDGIGRCARRWTASFDCATSTWTGPTEGSVTCGSAMGLDAWILTSSSGSACTLVYNQDLGQCCNSVGDCPTDSTAAPSLPADSVCSCSGGSLTSCPSSCADITGICGSTITVTITGCMATDNLGGSLNGSHVVTFGADGLPCSYTATRASDGNLILYGQCGDLAAFNAIYGVGPSSGSGIIFSIYGVYAGSNQTAYLYPLTAGACPQGTTYAVLVSGGGSLAAAGWGEWSFS